MSGFDIFLSYAFTFFAGLLLGGDARSDSRCFGAVACVIIAIIAVTRLFTLSPNL
jgi:hypothetical protein